MLIIFSHRNLYVSVRALSHLVIYLCGYFLFLPLDCESHEDRELSYSLSQLVSSPHPVPTHRSLSTNSQWMNGCKFSKAYRPCLNSLFHHQNPGECQMQNRRSSNVCSCLIGLMKGWLSSPGCRQNCFLNTCCVTLSLDVFGCKTGAQAYFSCLLWGEGLCAMSYGHVLIVSPPSPGERFREEI